MSDGDAPKGPPKKQLPSFEPKLVSEVFPDVNRPGKPQPIRTIPADVPVTIWSAG
jgi:hypothetical protein